MAMRLVATWLTGFFTTFLQNPNIFAGLRRWLGVI